ncbi:hypothetical protein B0H66DRAFT_530779 [Apodospora peruviana]|uniref:XPG N-terminal domain-containing protein n=1 Tax=Apodospora peruviana TaxID=516989 RepID=A0AAE0IKV2_9PEZI|nr:hypothetical protein B0H66DRAFT_530779 [Apodospora peruviana]
MGGMNHVVHIFYQHVQHLLVAGVHPIFVFDGPKKPASKGCAHPPSVRPCKHATHLLEGGNITAGTTRTEEDEECEKQLSHVIPMCRLLLDRMGLPYRDAPAEAECAVMERRPRRCGPNSRRRRLRLWK